jgi:hypothetical protein
MTNGEASSYKFTYNTDEPYDIDFDDPGPEIRPRVTLERSGDDPDRNTIPTQGFESQRLTQLSLSADLEDVPLVVNRSFDESLESVLTTLADDANAIWEFRREGDIESVEWTQPGQRTVERPVGVADYSVTKDVSERVEKAVVYGGSRDIRGESHTLDERFGEIALRHARVERNSVTVVRATSGTELTRGSDYTVRHDAGVIEPEPGGRMAAGDEFDVSYSFQTYGEHTRAGVEDPRETVVDAAELTTDFAAQQAAKAIVQELAEPMHRGTLTVAGDEAGFSVVEALAAADLPGKVGSGLGGVQVREVQREPGEARLRVGSRRSLTKIVDDLERGVSAVEREL